MKKMTVPTVKCKAAIPGRKKNHLSEANLGSTKRYLLFVMQI